MNTLGTKFSTSGKFTVFFYFAIALRSCAVGLTQSPRRFLLKEQRECRTLCHSMKAYFSENFAIVNTHAYDQ